MNKYLSAFAVYADKRMLVLFLLGLFSGLPPALIFSSLSLWLSEAGVTLETVTMFSWAGLAYSFKFVWAPLIDSLPVPVLSGLLGKRRAWLLVSQVSVAAAVCWMAEVDPRQAGVLPYMAAAAVLLGFSSATQDIVIDAYRIETAGSNAATQSATSASYTAGYRIGMIVSGAGVLYLAQNLGSTLQVYAYAAWRQTYLLMAAVMAAGILTTLLIKEPEASIRIGKENKHTASDNLRLALLFVSAVAGFVSAFVWLGGTLPKADGALGRLGVEAVRLTGALLAASLVGALLVRAGAIRKQLALDTWVLPVMDFFSRYGRTAALLLALIGLYRISDIVAGVIANVFYKDMGFDKKEIADAVKAFGMVMAIAGGFVGGALLQRFALMKMMMAGAVLASATNLLFIGLAYRGHDLVFMYFAVGFDNLASGLAGAVFVAFLSELTNVRFTAVQYAVLSSLMTLLPKTLGGYSGAIVKNIGYPSFFLFTALLGLPVLLLVYWADKGLCRQRDV